MIRTISVVSFLLVSMVAFSQVTPQTGADAADARIRAYLVKLALKNPEYKLMDYEEAQAEYDITIAKSAWGKNLTAAGNLNEYTINKKDNFPSLYPRYNFGLRLDLGMFFSIPAEVKKARVKKEMIGQERLVAQHKMKEEVLKAYEDYLMNKELYQLQQSNTDDAKSMLGKAETDFAASKVTLEVYNLIYQRYSTAQVQLVTSKRNLSVSKIILENMIGEPIEPIIARFNK